jgi:iron(III) transport system ATP-binding protein
VTLTVTVDRLEHARPPKFRLGPVSFAVPAGGRLAVVGPSGSGKTTLLRCHAGLERPGAGTIRIGEQLVDGPGVRVPPDRRQLGLVFQDGALWSHMTVLQHLTFAAPGMGKHDALSLLAQGGLDGHAHKKPGQLSGGEAQRLGLLRALAPRPAVLLLDEPLRSVDVHQRDQLVLLVRTLCDERDVTTILVTHDRDEALALATELVVLRDGQLVETGAAHDLLAAPRTAFTAAFLRGAACLPAPVTAGRAATLFGEFDAPAAQNGASDGLRLVLFPGDVEATDGDGPEARVLATLPDADGVQLKVACGDQILIARAAVPPASGTTRLALRAAPLLLPWHDTPLRDQAP